ncbi:MAG: DinB family protein [SAR202 cluster bacterium]|nr:DinB family protein [SAR202 cluster bacterium]
MTTDVREFTALTMERVRARTLEMVGGLTEAQLAWRAGPEANTIGFLLFHVFRAEDRYAHRWLTAKGEVWFALGHAERYPLPVQIPDRDSPLNSGNSWTPEQVGAFKAPPLTELLAYGAAVRKSSLAIVRGFDLKRLDERPNAKQPQFSMLTYFQNCFGHETEHQAQIDFILGLKKAQKR